MSISGINPRNPVGSATILLFWLVDQQERTGGRTVAGRTRSFDREAAWAFVPVVAVVPVWLGAMTALWLVPSRWLGFGSAFASFALVYLTLGVSLFVPIVQRWVLTLMVGARRPHRNEADRIRPAFDEVVQAMHLRRHRFVVGVIDSSEPNAFAVGGHLVVVTSFAATNLDHDRLCGVLAHELCHHLGLHTVALTIHQWLLLPVSLLARLGRYLDNVARAATNAFAGDSRPLLVVGRIVSGLFTILGTVFGAGVAASNVIGNAVGRSAEFAADRRVVAAGFGRQLADALRVTHASSSRRPTHRRGRFDHLVETHPPALTRITRIEAALRARRRRHPSTGLD